MRSFIENLKKCNTIFSKEQKKWTVYVLLLSIIGAVFETMGVSIIMPFADVLLQPNEAYQNSSYQVLIRWFGIDSAEQLILFLAIAIVILYIVKNVYFMFLSWIRARYAEKLNTELSSRMMKGYMSKGYTFFSNTNTGELIQGTQGDVICAKLVVYNAMKLVTDLLSVSFIAIFLFMVDWQLASGVGIMAMFCFLVVGRLFSRVSYKAGEKSRKYQAKANQKLLQAFQGIKEVLVLKKEDFFTRAYNRDFALQLREDTTRVVCSEFPAYVIEGSCVSVIFAIICCRVIMGGVSDELVPVLASFVVAAFRILPAIGKMTSEYSSINYYFAGLDSVYRNFKEVCNGTDELTSLNNTESVEEKRITFEKQLQLVDIVFSYENKQERIINHLDLTIKKGEAIAFVGPSGSGKTTLSDIILGILKPQSGRILVDEQNIIDAPLAWSKMVGYVSQTMYLVDDTIRVNVAFGVNEEDIDDNRVWECLRRAQIEDYVRRMDKGIYTTVGDHGMRISGGQRQRIAIARSLYHNPQVLVLDEATSALDNDTEKAVMESIEALQGEITMIIVAHRLSTVKNCDRIYEISNGVAVEKSKQDIIWESVQE